jgi:hypothetical protein
MKVYSLSFYSAIAPKWKADMSIMHAIKKTRCKFVHLCVILLIKEMRSQLQGRHFMNCKSTINNGGTCALDTLIENIIDKDESTLGMGQFWQKINSIKLISQYEINLKLTHKFHLKFSPTTPFWKYFFIFSYYVTIIISYHKCDVDIFKIINVC